MSKAHSDETGFGAILLRALQSAVQYETPSQGQFANLQGIIQIIDAFGAMSTKSIDVRHKVLRSLSSNTLAAPLRRFLEHDPSSLSGEHTMQGHCPIQHRLLQVECHRRLCLLIVQIMLYARDNDLSPEPSLAIALLEKQTHLCAIQLKCNFFGHRGLIQKPEEVSLFGAGSTPQDMPSHAWRDRLIETFSRDARYQHQTVVQMVGEVCRDLEARCDNAEQPFRDEQARSHDLQQRLKSSEDRNVELEGQRDESCYVISSLETKTSHLQERADTAEQRSESLQVEVDRMRQTLEHAEKEAVRATNASSEAARKQDLTYMETIMGKNKQYQEQVTKSELLEVRIAELLKQCGSGQEREDQQKNELACLKESVARSSHELNVLETLAAERLATIEELKSLNAKVNSDILILSKKVLSS